MLVGDGLAHAYLHYEFLYWESGSAFVVQLRYNMQCKPGQTIGSAF